MSEERKFVKIDRTKALSDADMGTVAGGYVFDGRGVPGCDQRYPFELINDTTGKVMACFENWNDCVDSAYLNGQSAFEIDEDDYRWLTGNYYRRYYD